jgi:hypothetical protein
MRSLRESAHPTVVGKLVTLMDLMVKLRTTSCGKKEPLQSFPKSGLYQVLIDKAFALSNPDLNAIADGMITTAMSKGDANCLFTSVAFTGNGHAAWENICSFYESEEMLNMYIKSYMDEFNELEVTPPADYMNFFSRFMYLKVRMDMLYILCTKKEIKPQLDPVKDYRVSLLEKVKINSLGSRSEIIRRENAAKVTVHSLDEINRYFLEFLFENKIPPVKKQKNAPGKTHGDKQVPSASVSGPGTNGGKQQSLFSKLCEAKKMATDDKDKAALQTIIDQEKEKNHSHPNQSNSSKKKKNEKGYRRDKRHCAVEKSMATPKES